MKAFKRLKQYLLHQMLANLKKIFKQQRIVVTQRRECKAILKSVDDKRSLTKEQCHAIQCYFNTLIGRSICPLWHRLYLEGEYGFSENYIPVDILFSEIIPKLNVDKFCEAYADKSRYEMLFPDITHPQTVMKRVNGSIYVGDQIVNQERLWTLLPKDGKVILKPTLDTSQGQGVKIINLREIDSKEKMDFLLEENGLNFIIQEKISSHPIVNDLNPSSLNTLRIITYRKDEEVYVLSTTLKIGKNGAIVDNGHHGGFFCGVTEIGRLRKYIYTLNPFTVSTKTENGITIEGIELPNFEKIKAVVKQCAKRLPYARYVGWDVAISSEGIPILIEVNLKCPGGNIMQIPNGPLFGDYTKMILEDLYRSS